MPTDPRLWGGTMMVNGIKIIVPNNTILQMPATSLTWAQLFDPNISVTVPGGATNIHVAGQTGLALADTPPPFPSFEVRAVGNVVGKDPVTGEPRYIVALILPISQQGLNSGAGVINYIDYATGRFRVGARINWVQTGGPGVPLSNYDTLSPTFTAPRVLPGGADLVMTFQLTVSDQFGSTSATVKITVRGQADNVIITGAIWRNQNGGKLTVTATSSDAAAVLSVDIVMLNSNVISLGTMTASAPRVYIMNKIGVAAPVLVVIHSSVGGLATSPVTIR